MAEHVDCLPGRQFADVQRSGPFRRWRHEHRLSSAGSGTTLEDAVAVELPGGWIGHRLGERAFLRLLDGLFAFRHRRTLHDLRRHAGVTSLFRAAVWGGERWLRGQVEAFLAGGGHEVVHPESATDVDLLVWVSDPAVPVPNPPAGMHARRVLAVSQSADPAPLSRLSVSHDEWISIWAPLVLTAGGGAPRLPIVGVGREPQPWIALDDLLGLILHVARGQAPGLAIAAVAPEAITAAELRRRLHLAGIRRPGLAPVPPVRLDVEAGRRALADTGFRWCWPEFDAWLETEFGRASYPAA